jgi:hypothetical protein
MDKEKVEVNKMNEKNGKNGKNEKWIVFADGCLDSIITNGELTFDKDKIVLMNDVIKGYTGYVVMNGNYNIDKDAAAEMVDIKDRIEWSYNTKKEYNKLLKYINTNALDSHKVVVSRSGYVLFLPPRIVDFNKIYKQIVDIIDSHCNGVYKDFIESSLGFMGIITGYIFDGDARRFIDEYFLFYDGRIFYSYDEYMKYTNGVGDIDKRIEETMHFIIANFELFISRYHMLGM